MVWPPDVETRQGANACRLAAASQQGAAHVPEPARSPTADAGTSVLQRVADIPLPGGTGRFDYQSVDSISGRLYLSHMGSGDVIVFDTRAARVLGVIGGLPRVTGVWAVPELNRVYASAAGLHQVAIIDARTLKVIARVGRVGFPDGIAYAPAVRKVFVSDESGGGEVVVDVARDRVSNIIPIGGEAGNTIYDGGSGCILVAIQTTNEIVAIDPALERVVGRYQFAGLDHPHGLSVDAARRLLFVANQGNATLTVINLSTLKVMGHFAVGGDPDVLAFDPGWRRLYVAAEAGPLIIFDERDSSLTRLGTLSLPNAHSVAVSQQTHLLYLPLRDVGGRPVLRIMRGSAPTVE